MLTRQTEGLALADRLIQSLFKHCTIQGGSLWIKENFVAPAVATALFERLYDEVNWQQPVIRMGAKTINSPRLAAWYGDAGAVYTYSGLKNNPKPWAEPMLEIRRELEETIGIRFNSVLLNLYRDGGDSMGWHRDNESELGQNPTIASLSLGEERKFAMRHVKDRSLRWETILKHGMLLIMTGETQRCWKHCVPKSKVHNGTRINLTFRQIGVRDD